MYVLLVTGSQTVVELWTKKQKGSKGLFGRFLNFGHRRSRKQPCHGRWRGTGGIRAARWMEPTFVELHRWQVSPAFLVDRPSAANSEQHLTSHYIIPPECHAANLKSRVFLRSPLLLSRDFAIHHSLYPSATRTSYSCSPRSAQLQFIFFPRC